MSLRYRDKVVIVTGGSKGIGRGVVKAFVAEGAKVVFCARGGAAGETLEAELNKDGPGTCLFVPCDVSKEDDIKRLIAVTVERHGRIDCLVNNAGWHPPHIPTDDTLAEDFKDLLNLNLISYFLAAKFALPHLRKTQGSIINVSSLVGIIGQKYAAPYVATKWLYSLHASRRRYSTDWLDFLMFNLRCAKKSWGAITAMSKAMAVDESRHNVRVNTISPGNVMTPLWQESAAHNPDAEAAIREGETWQLLGRMGTEEECGKAALFLAADATFCTGIDLLLSGGAELNYGVKSQISS